jgi:hypothetical protein
MKQLLGGDGVWRFDRTVVGMFADVEVPLTKRIVHFRDDRAQSRSLVQAKPEVHGIERETQHPRHRDKHGLAVRFVHLGAHQNVAHERRSGQITSAVVFRPYTEDIGAIDRKHPKAPALRQCTFAKREIGDPVGEAIALRPEPRVHHTRLDE